MRHVPKSSIGVLVADDSTTICKLIAQLLQREKSIHIVGVAGTLDDTLHLAAEFTPDILVLDLHLDEMSLHEATRVKIALLSCVRRIVCTSTKTDAQEFQLAQSYGAACLVDKFWLSEQLVGSILACSDSKRRRRFGDLKFGESLETRHTRRPSNYRLS
jgi:DNA-binding NarL/FixJ family response regulator